MCLIPSKRYTQLDIIYYLDIMKVLHYIGSIDVNTSTAFSLHVYISKSTQYKVIFLSVSHQTITTRHFKVH